MVADSLSGLNVYQGSDGKLRGARQDASRASGVGTTQ